MKPVNRFNFFQCSMWNLWYNLEPVEGGQYLVEVEVEENERKSNIKRTCIPLSTDLTNFWNTTLNFINSIILPVF